MAKTLEEYLALPYTIVLRRDVRDQIFVARVEELPGCSAHGDTESEALSNLQDNMKLWIGDCLESGDIVPEPSEEVELPSGKWLQRVPRSLHLKLIRLAKDEGVSLNQFVTAVLAEAAGEKAARCIRESVASLMGKGIDPWSVVPQAGAFVWKTHFPATIDRFQLNQGIQDLLRKMPAFDLYPALGGRNNGDKETHETWNTELPEIPSR